MLRLLKAWGVTLLLLLTLSISCTTKVPVAVPTPGPSCDLSPIPIFPSTNASACGPSVCIPPADAAAIWLWARDMQRWAEHAQVCVDSAALLPAGTGPVLAVRTFADFELQSVVNAMYHPGVDVTVTFARCGELNAYYWFEAKKVTMCTEVLALDPGTVRFILAHELAHAVIHQLDLPYTGSLEATADELAAYALFKMGRSMDVMAAGAWWLELSEEGRVEPWADHPEHLQRYFTLTCLALSELKMPGQYCHDTSARVRHTWDRLLKL